MRQNVLQVVKREKLVVILRGIPDIQLMPVVEAVLNAGGHCVEIPFCNDSQATVLHSKQQLSRLHAYFGADLRLGAGTVITEEQVLMAKAAGSEYIISPNCNEAVIKRTKEEGLISMPGAYTASEVVAAYGYGADVVKVFPLPGGSASASYIKSLQGPLRHIPMMAVGGVNLTNLRDVMRAGAIGVGIGKGIVSAELIKDFQAPADYATITRRVAEYLNLLSEFKAAQ